MQPIYEHRQVGQLMLVLLIVPIFGLFLALLLAGQSFAWVPGIVVLAVMVLTAVMFSSLTVVVGRQQVEIFFGFGFPRRSFPISQIASVQVVSNPAWMGLGIHFIHNGMIYNVSGRQGIEITLADGRLARIGTDEPEAVVQAIMDAKAFQ